MQSPAQKADPVAIEFFTPWGSLETRVSGSGASLASRRLFETEGIPMDDGDQAVARRRRFMWTILGDYKKIFGVVA